jgi:hypothetical protein
VLCVVCCGVPDMVVFPVVAGIGGATGTTNCCKGVTNCPTTTRTHCVPR